MGKRNSLSRLREGKLRKFSSTCSLVENNIVILGDGQVGKTSLIKRYFDQEFEETYIPTVSEIFAKKIFLQDEKKCLTGYSLRLFDTAGSIAFPAMNRIVISQGCAFVVVYSVDSETSFEAAGRLLKEIAKIKEEKVACVLVGNKSDLAEDQRKVSFERAVQLAVQWGASCMEASAKENCNVSDIFEGLIRKMEALELFQMQSAIIRRKCSSFQGPSAVLGGKTGRKISEGSCKVM